MTVGRAQVTSPCTPGWLATGRARPGPRQPRALAAGKRFTVTA